MSMPLSVSLFPDAEHSPADRVGTGISDTVATAAALGYSHVVLTLSPPIYSCARPAASGVDATVRLMGAARKQAACTTLPKPYTPKVSTTSWIGRVGLATRRAGSRSTTYLLTANKEVREFEEVLAAMPKLDAFNSKPESGCCFGKLCCHPQLDADRAGPSLDKCASCGNEHHHLCATENVWLKWIGDDKIEGRTCFDCWLLEVRLRNTIHRAPAAGEAQTLSSTLKPTQTLMLPLIQTS